MLQFDSIKDFSTSIFLGELIDILLSEDDMSRWNLEYAIFLKWKIH